MFVQHCVFVWDRRHTHCFCVATHGQKPLVASAATASERDAWILQISKVIRCLKALHREEGDINSARASFRRQRSAKYCRDLARAVTTALLCEAEAHPPSKYVQRALYPCNVEYAMCLFGGSADGGWMS